MTVMGIDLAWGERNPDGYCVIRGTARTARVAEWNLVHGDTALLATIARHRTRGTLLAVDAPLVVPNRTGARPVDRLTHRLFHRQHAACHPANQTLVRRPVRLSRRWTRLGFPATAAPPRRGTDAQIEVYPHLACVRFFHLDRILKYKRGPVAARHRELARYQRLLRDCLAQRFPEINVPAALTGPLNAPRWSKPVEDQLDALLCALVGWEHLRSRGHATEILGDDTTGFLVIPTVNFGSTPPHP